MKKAILAAAALTAMILTPAHAADVTTCDDASVTLVADAIKNAEITGKADNAMVDLNKAKEAMAAGKTEDCVTALNSAMMQLQNP